MQKSEVSRVWKSFRCKKHFSQILQRFAQFMERLLALRNQSRNPCAEQKEKGTFFLTTKDSSCTFLLCPPSCPWNCHHKDHIANAFLTRALASQRSLRGLAAPKHPTNCHAVHLACQVQSMASARPNGGRASLSQVSCPIKQGCFRSASQHTLTSYELNTEAWLLPSQATMHGQFLSS